MSTTIGQGPTYVDDSGGDVDGPGSSTTNAIAKFADTTGKVLANSGVLIDSSNNVTTAGALHLYGAGNGDTVIATRYSTDTGNRFYVENSGNHYWCSAGDGVITHELLINPLINGYLVVDDGSGTAGQIQAITRVLTNEVLGTSSNDLTLTTNNSARRVIITRIPVLSSLSATVSAFAGGGQGSATTLTSYYNAVTTVASANDSVKLSTTTNMPVSSQVVVKNCTSTNNMDVYPDSGSQFFYLTLQSANTSISVAPGNSLTFYRRTSTIWDVI